MTTLYFHIGLAKTATSYIQTFLQNNYKSLLEQDILYLESYRSGSHNNLILPLRDATQHQLKYDNWQENFKSKIYEIEEEIKEKQSNKVILSSEATSSIYQYRQEKIELLLSYLLKRVNIKIIIYLRRQDDFITSYYKQKIKRGQYYDFINKFIEEYKWLLNYYNLLEFWQSYVGKENLIVRVYEKQQFKNNNILDDFFEAIDCPNIQRHTFESQSLTPINTSPSGKIVKLIQLLNYISIKIMFKSQEELKSFYIKTLLNKNRKTTKLINKIPDWLISPELLSKESRIKLMQEFEESNQKVAREYLNRPDGKLFYSSP